MNCVLQRNLNFQNLKILDEYTRQKPLALDWSRLWLQAVNEVEAFSLARMMLGAFATVLYCFTQASVQTSLLALGIFN